MNRRRSLSTTKKPNNKQIFKKFLEFLESGVWTMPISMFTEQHSILFDREQGDPNTYDHLHKEFASLVDVLIESYCDDVGLTPRELVEALKSTDQSTKLSYRERILLEPVVAAQDFNVFVPMMMRKSIEMQLQALHMLT
uniref:Cilia- and flagella-associated protein 36 n=1 Tax=Acrobeloides nanus TaxID=290746 RepID=A0A914D9L6_9BILA